MGNTQRLRISVKKRIWQRLSASALLELICGVTARRECASVQRLIIARHKDGRVPQNRETQWPPRWEI